MEKAGSLDYNCNVMITIDLSVITTATSRSVISKLTIKHFRLRLMIIIVINIVVIITWRAEAFGFIANVIN